MTIRRPSPYRLAMIAGLIGLAILTKLSAGAYQQQRRTARSLVTGLAIRVAERYVSDLQAQLYIGGTALLNRAGLGRIQRGNESAGAAAILAAVPAVAECRCAPNLHPRYAFTADLGTGRIEVVAADSSQTVPAPSVELLRAEMRGRPVKGGWEFAVATRPTPDGALLFFARVDNDTSRLVGFAVDTAEVRYRIIKEVDQQRGEILAASGLSAGDSGGVTLQVQLATGETLFNYPATPAVNLHGAAVLPRLFGSWRVSVGMLPQTVTAVVGAGTGSSPFILMMVLAALAAMALIVAGRAAQRAAELAAMRATLITGMSHELRTPLTEILLVGESIQRGQYHDGRDIAGAIDVVVREAHRLLGMISNVLQISMTGGAATRVGVSQRIGDEIRRVVEDFRGIAAGYECSVVVTIRDDDPVSVDLDAVRQILNNFLDNACRYGGPGQEIAVELTRHTDVLRLTVRDQGPGIPLAHRESVWQPFVRGPQPEGRERFGSGIGLAVARQLAESMHGRTGIEANDAPGAAVYLEFDLTEKAA